MNQAIWSLQRFHEAGLCHDDAKPANIFEAKDTRWILGDSGSLRYAAHPYNTSLLKSENEQLLDCPAHEKVACSGPSQPTLRTSVANLKAELASFV